MAEQLVRLGLGVRVRIRVRVTVRGTVRVTVRASPNPNPNTNLARERVDGREGRAEVADEPAQVEDRDVAGDLVRVRVRVQG